MTTSALDFDDALRAPVKLIPVILVAGVPVVLVPAGCHPTQTAVTSGTVDSAWWPGTGSLSVGIPDTETDGTLYLDPVRDWLDIASVWSTVEQARPLEGDVRVEAFRFDLHDIDEAVTSALSGRNARLGQFLAGDITALSTTIPVDLLAGFPAKGIAHIGREAVVYDATGTTDGVHSIRLTGGLARRGAFGSAPSTHRAPRTRRPLVTVGAYPRNWQGRRVTVFLAELSADGTTIMDPTPIYMGTAIAGVRLTDSGTRYQVPLDPVTETATRKFSQRSVMLAGIQWQNGPFAPGHPLRVGAAFITRTRHGGYAATPDDFVSWWNEYAAAVGSIGAGLSRDDDGRLRLNFTHDITDAIHASWDSPGVLQSGSMPSARVWLSSSAMPSTTLTLDGRIKIGAEDLAQLPSTVSVSVVDPSPGLAQYTLVADTDTTKGVTATIDAIDSVNSIISVTAILPPDPLQNRDMQEYLRRERITQVSKATAATIGVEARGGHALGALRALVRAVDALDGGGLEEDSIDWTHLARQMARIPLGNIPEARDYRTSGDDSLLAILLDELRLRGMYMAMRGGRVTGVRLADFASSERSVAEITEGDIVLDDGDVPTPIMPEVTDNTEPLATGITFTFADGGSFSWVDTTSLDDFGPGARIESKALRHLPEGTASAALAVTLQGVAQQLLGVLAEPSRIFRVTLPASFLGLFAGDIVRLTHSQLPDWQGRRGLDRAVCQVFDVERAIFGEESRALVRLRLSAADVAGYAPAFLVAAGGISMATLTADVTTGFGPTCFADPESGDVLDGFETGDHVVLSEYDALTPALDTAYATVTALDRAAHKMTLSSAPGTSWELLAASAEKVVVRLAAYGDAVVRQRRAYAFLADDATQVLGGADAPDRWAA